MNFALHVLTLGAMTCLPLLGYNLVFGRGKIMHFGQEASSLLAVYVLWVTTVRYGWSFPTAFLLACTAVGLLALLFAWLALRLEPDGLGVLTIAMHLIALAVVLNWNSVTRGALGIPRIPRGVLPTSPEGFACLAVGTAILWATLLWWAQRGPLGRALTALAEQPWYAGALGISRPLVYTIAFLLAGCGSLLSAMLFPPYLYLISPANYDFPVLILFVLCIVAGGPGRVWGVALTTIGIVALREGLRFLALPADVIGPTRLLLFGAILFGAVWLRRDTLFPQERTV